MFLSTCCSTDWKMKNEINIPTDIDIYKEFTPSPSKGSFFEHVVDDPKSLLDNSDEDRELFKAMSHEKNRVCSFNGKWPLQFVHPVDLAESGFFYLQSEDRVQCAFCKVVINNWKSGDRPLREHMKKSPKCPFLMSSNAGNVPVQSKASSNYCNQYIPAPSASRSCKPKNPRMADLKKRLSTFAGWPLTMIHPNKLADCGLYYTGVADVVTCFFCGGSLGNWEPLDEPIVEHTKFYPNCVFLHMLRCRPIQETKDLPVSQETPTQNHQPSVKQAVASEMLKSEVVQQANEIFSPSVVYDVVLEHLKQTGQTFTSLHELCEKVLENDEKRIRERVNPTEKGAVGATGVSHSGIIPMQSAATLDVKDRLLCKICMDTEVGIVFQPCGHLATCETCAAIISECPLCRKLIETRVKTYWS